MYLLMNGLFFQPRNHLSDRSEEAHVVNDYCSERFHKIMRNNIGDGVLSQ